MMTDPIADLLTRIRNALTAGHAKVAMPASQIKLKIAEIMKAEGYIEDVAFDDSGIQGTITVRLRYNPETGESPIHGLKRISRPGRRIYSKGKEMPEVLGGLGVSIVSTSRGIMTGKAAGEANVGGEVLCEIW